MNDETTSTPITPPRPATPRPAPAATPASEEVISAIIPRPAAPASETVTPGASPMARPVPVSPAPILEKTPVEAQEAEAKPEAREDEMVDAPTVTVISAIPDVTEEASEAALHPQARKPPKWLRRETPPPAEGEVKKGSKLPLLLTGGAGLLLAGGVGLLLRPQHQEVAQMPPPISTQVIVTPMPATPPAAVTVTTPVSEPKQAAKATAEATARPEVRAALVNPDPGVAGAFTGGEAGNAQTSTVQSAQQGSISRRNTDIVAQTQQTPTVVQASRIPQPQVTPTPTPVINTPPQNVPVVVTPAPASSQPQTTSQASQIKVYPTPAQEAPVVIRTTVAPPPITARSLPVRVVRVPQTAPQTLPQLEPVVVRVPEVKEPQAKVEEVRDTQATAAVLKAKPVTVTALPTPQVVVTPAPHMVVTPATSAAKPAAPSVTNQAGATPEQTKEAKSVSSAEQAASPARAAPAQAVAVQVTPLVEYLGYAASDEEKTAIIRVSGRDEIGVAGQDIPGTNIHIRSVTPTSLTIETEADTKTVPLTEKP